MVLDFFQVVESIIIVVLISHGWVDGHRVLVRVDWVSMEVNLLGCVFAHPSVLGLELDAGFPLGSHGIELVEELLVLILLV